MKTTCSIRQRDRRLAHTDHRVCLQHRSALADLSQSLEKSLVRISLSAAGTAHGSDHFIACLKIKCCYSHIHHVCHLCHHSFIPLHRLFLKRPACTI